MNLMWISIWLAVGLLCDWFMVRVGTMVSQDQKYANLKGARVWVIVAGPLIILCGVAILLWRKR